MKDYLSVKEFSKLSGIETTTLRYWDDIGLFSPAKRDPDNNYRYYSPAQIIAVNFVLVLSSLNIPLKTIDEMKEERDPNKIMSLIDRQEHLLDMEMMRLRECYSIIHTRREMIKHGLNADESKISVEKLKERAVILGPPCNFKEKEPFYEPFMRFCKSAQSLRINLHYPIGGYHESAEAFFKSPGQPDRFFSLDPTGNVKVKEGQYMIAYNRGFYGEFSEVTDKMKNYAEEHSLVFTGPLFVMYLLDEICINDPKDYLSAICVNVRKK